MSTKDALNEEFIREETRHQVLAQFLMSIMLKGDFTFKGIIKSLRLAKKVLDKELEEAYRLLYKDKVTLH